MDDYELLDAGGGARLERFGEHVVDRPHGAAWGARLAPARWSEADLRFDRDRGWSGEGLAAAMAGWTVEVHGLTFELRPTDAGQVGLYPEHARLVPTLQEALTARTTVGAHDAPVSVLHLFASTGLLTLALARDGAAVTHVDASRPSVAWARRNAARNALEDRPIRWIVDDARAFATRERRRARRYDGIVLDPPTYGHGTDKTAWRLETDLEPLLDTCAALLADHGFLQLTAHTEGFGGDRLASLVRAALGTGRGGPPSTGDLEIEAASGGTLTLGAYALVDGRR